MAPPRLTLVLVAALALGLAAASPLAAAGPPDPGNPCRPQCRAEVNPEPVHALLSALPDPEDACLPPC